MPARHYGSDYERTGDSIAIANYMGGTDEFDQAIASFAVSYAEQNDEDYAVFKELLKSATSRAEPLSGQPSGLPVGET